MKNKSTKANMDPMFEAQRMCEDSSSIDNIQLKP